MLKLCTTRGQEPPIAVSCRRMQDSPPLSDDEVPKVVERLGLVDGAGPLSVDEMMLIGRMAKLGMKEIDALR